MQEVWLPHEQARALRALERSVRSHSHRIRKLVRRNRPLDAQMWCAVDFEDLVRTARQLRHALDAIVALADRDRD